LGGIVASRRQYVCPNAQDFFFEKKKQKTFAHLAAASPERLSPDSQKFFGSFFQKRTSSFSSPER
jgi:hypothetical protein